MRQNFYTPQNFTTPAQIYSVTYEKINGINTKTYKENGIFFCSVKSYGGTETVQNNVLVIEDTITVESWFDDRITAETKIKLLDDNTEYEVISSPENIDRRNQFMIFKAKRINTRA